MDAPPFWHRKSLSEMNRKEWESLCDGCARCCLVKLEDAATARIYYTDVACRLLDKNTCRCTDYGHRKRRVPDCVQLTPRRAAAYGWLPPTCAYRLLAEGSPLYWWHPLVSGDPATVHQAGISVRGRLAGSERDFPSRAAERKARESGAGKLDPAELEHHIVNWPLAVPPSAKREGPARQPSKTPTPRRRRAWRGKVKKRAPRRAAEGSGAAT